MSGVPAQGGAHRSAPILSVRDLAVRFRGRSASDTGFRAVDGVSFTVHPRQTLAIVGESGCGKSVTALSMLRLVPSPPSQIESGSARFASRTGEVDLVALEMARIRSLRGSEIAMIFQEPMSSLNPVFTVGEQITEAILLHQRVGRGEARQIAIEAMNSVGIVEPERRLGQYPHQFSGGMRQRVMIAMALACHPTLLIADEPTTALDVTIQAQILELLRELKTSRGMSILLITHDMGVVAENADVVCVMYAGRVVEYAPVFALFDRPLHPYTRGLLASIPRLGARRERLATIREIVDNPEQFGGLSAQNRPIVPWWPWHQPPETLRPIDGVAGNYALIEIEPQHWIGVWRTDAVDERNPPPDCAFHRESVTAGA